MVAVQCYRLEAFEAVRVDALESKVVRYRIFFEEVRLLRWKAKMIVELRGGDLDVCLINYCHIYVTTMVCRKFALSSDVMVVSEPGMCGRNT